MRAEDQDALDVAGAAGAGDEADEAGIVSGVLLLEQGEGRGQIGDELIPAREDDVMRRQDGKRAAAGAAGGDEDAAGLGDEGVASVTPASQLSISRTS